MFFKSKEKPPIITDNTIITKYNTVIVCLGKQGTRIPMRTIFFYNLNFMATSQQ